MGGGVGMMQTTCRLVGKAASLETEPALVLNCVRSLNKNDVLIHKVYLYCRDIFNTYLKCLTFYNLSDKTKTQHLYNTFKATK